MFGSWEYKFARNLINLTNALCSRVPLHLELGVRVGYLYLHLYTLVLSSPPNRP